MCFVMPVQVKNEGGREGGGGGGQVISECIETVCKRVIGG